MTITLLTHVPGARRAEQYAELVRLLGDEAAMEASNAIDQVGLESPSDRAEVMDALISSINQGQRWATGEAAVEVKTCLVCEGSKHSRSGRGTCRACHGWGRQQVQCRACAEKTSLERSRTTCVECVGRGYLDPVTNRETILRQHRTWWERVTKMKTEATWSGSVRGHAATGKCVSGVWFGSVHAHPTDPTTRIIANASHEDRDEMIGMLTEAMRQTEELYPADTHAGPPERPTAQRGCVHRHYGAISMFWDKDIGNDATGIGTLEKPFCTFQVAESAAEMATEMRAKEIRLERERVPFDVDAAAGDTPLAATSPMPRSIASALFRAQTHIRKVVKSSENQGDGYEYTSAEVIVDEARTALHQAGLAIVPHSWDRTTTTIGNAVALIELEVTFMLIHESGEQYICVPVRMPIVEDSGKEKRAPDKALATALTYCQSQYERVLLQIPRIGRSEDADARTDVGDGGRRAKKRDTEDRTPLSTELNDAVVAMHKAIDAAKDAKGLAGVGARMAALGKDLPEAVVNRLNDAIQKRAVALNLPTIGRTT